MIRVSNSLDPDQAQHFVCKGYRQRILVGKELWIRCLSVYPIFLLFFLFASRGL